MTGLTDEQKSNFKLMKSVGEVTRTAPKVKKSQLEAFSRRLQQTSEVQHELQNWNLQFNYELQSVPGRLLPGQEIRMRNNQLHRYDADNADWGVAFRDKKLYVSPECKKWAVVYPKNAEKETQEFIKLLVNSAGKIGFNLSCPQQQPIADNRTPTYSSSVLALSNQKPEMIMTVVPNNKSDSYHTIKKILCVDRPIPSQVMTLTVLKKPKGLGSVAQKVAIQMATKLGAEPWSVAIPLSVSSTKYGS